MTVTVPVASIVITNRDYGRFLGEAIDSALVQDDVEVIVVDDGSTDDSMAVIAGFGDQVQVISQSGEGQGAAMMAGFAESHGPVIVFLDADDRLAPGVVAEAAARLRDSDVARVHYPLQRIDADSRPHGGTVPPVIDSLPAGDLRAAIITHPDDLAWQPTSGNAYRRDVLDAILPMAPEAYRISADHYLNALSGLHGRVERLHTIGGDYRIHGANADARDRFDLARVQGIVARSLVTQSAVAATGAALGLPAAPQGGSISFQVNRQVSLRLGRATHPVAGDSRRQAWRDGVRACRGRTDLSRLRRLAGVGFVTAVASVPRRAVPRLVTGLVRGTTDPGPPR